ncbi:MAG: primosomal protein N' [Proteobacteria bacterium]|nr:MAG: primosomal protein N' [Pseudomonadota bacterium]
MPNTLGTVRVVIPRPLYQAFDYSCPRPLPVAGCRVRVPLGRHNTVVGIVSQSDIESEFSRLKPIDSVLDDEPLLDESLLALLDWASIYYHHPIGEVFFSALPKRLREGHELSENFEWHLNCSDSESALNNLKRAPLQRTLFLQLQANSLTEAQLTSLHLGKWRKPMQQLQEKGFVERRKIISKVKTGGTTDHPNQQFIALSDEQNQSLTQLLQWQQDNTQKPVLLQGITGSGKTEIYLRVIKPVLEQGQQALLMVPEIGLTPQLFQRFCDFFPNKTVAALHSGLSDSQRAQNWQSAYEGDADIVVGTRSSIFCAFKRLGIIIIDEEHDSSLKQQEGFRYHARDLAVKRANQLNIPILLGSATPALESLLNAERGRYHYLQLKKRPGTRKPPKTSLIDLRGQKIEAGVSSTLLSAVGTHIRAANQVMLFLNRRGYAPILLCTQCGWCATCSACDAAMTFHSARHKAICHHCGHQQNIDIKCPACNNPQLTTQGHGTERVEQLLRSHFPETPVIRVDRDTTSRKGELNRKLERVRSGEPVILIGTQMLTKGHDFPNLTLVGILDIDQALFSADYRAQEHLAQQIVQVSGRAGRGDRPGHVMLQTSQPQHPMLNQLLTQGYRPVAQQLLAERQAWQYPPFGFQALIRANAPHFEMGLHFLDCLRNDLQTLPIVKAGDVALLGPMPSPMEKRADRYRYQLLISANRRSSLHWLLDQLISVLKQRKRPRDLRYILDVDPTNFM